MMMIQLTCSCGKNLRVKDQLAGKQVRCPDCSQPVRVPEAATLAASLPEPIANDATLPPSGPAETATIPPELPVATLPPPSHPAGLTTIDGESPGPERNTNRAAEVPGYEILSELGRGGMGVVYKALHLQLNRVVALKMILSGGHASSADLVRFLAEAEAVATLQHPNIVQVYEVSHHRHLPYMALEFVEGGSLAGRLKNGPLSAKESTRLVELIAHGMNAAHQAGIVHRDLKPDNVLLTKDGVPKITDFGLAKRVEGDSGLTRSGAIMGTPSYMAPEQASGEGKRVGPAADVYALGGILYACLTGRPPFQASTPLDTILQVVSEEPKPPSQLNPRIPKDLETICLKCLNKEPVKRYPNAEALAEDLRRYSKDEPITARPVSRTERMVKWVRRNKAMAGALLAIFLVLVLGAGISIWQAIEAFSQQQIAQAEARRANENEQQAKLNEQNTLKALDKANHALYLSMLDQASFVYQKEPYKALEYLHDDRFCPTDRRCAIWRFYERQCTKWLKCTHPGHSREVTSVDFSPDGQTLASGSSDGTIKLWDVATGKEIATLKGHTILAKGALRYPSKVTSVSFSPDGKTLASAAGTNDGYGPLKNYGEIKLWDVTTRQVIATLEGHESIVTSVIFSPDGKTLASIGRDQKHINLWDINTGKGKATLTGHASHVASISFSPDGKTLASAGGGFDKTTKKSWVDIKLWDVNTGEATATLEWHTKSVTSVSFSPDGKTLASAGGGFDIETNKQWGEITLWDVKAGVEKNTLKGHKSLVRTLRFSPNGKMLASGGGAEVGGGGDEVDGGEIKLWDVSTGQVITSLRGHGLGVSSVRFSPDGKTLASSSFDKTIKLWKVEFGQEIATLQAHKNFSRSVTSMIFSPDGKTLASVNQDTIKLWDVTTGKEKPPLKRPNNTSRSLSFSPNGKTLALATMDNTVEICDVETGEVKTTLKVQAKPGFSLRFSPDGTILAWAIEGNTMKLWDVKTGQVRTTVTLEGKTGGVLSLSPDGKTLFSTSGKVNEYGEITLWDVESGQVQATFKGHKSTINSFSLSPDGKTLASASRGLDRLGGAPLPGEIKLWDMMTGQEKVTLTGHKGQVLGVSFSPDGKTLASAGGDTGPSSDSIPGELILWDVMTGQAKATLSGHASTVWSVSFSPDGTTIASASQDKTIKLWDIRPSR